MKKRIKENAARLSTALFNNSADKGVVRILAHYLHYEPDQLAKDIDDLYKSVYAAKKNEKSY